MNRIRLLAAGTILLFTLTAVAQQSTTNSNAHDMMGGSATVEKQLTLLTDKLALTADQQTRTKTILQQLDEKTQQIMQDESMSVDERMGNVRTCHHQADKELRQILNDDQKKKLDQFEQEPHPEMHANVNAPTPQM